MISNILHANQKEIQIIIEERRVKHLMSVSTYKTFPYHSEILNLIPQALSYLKSGSEHISIQ